MCTSLAYALAKRFNAKLVCQILDFPKFRLSGEEPWASNLKKYLGISLSKYKAEWDEIGEALKRADLVLAISKTTAKDVEDMFGVKAEVNYLGVDAEIADRCLAGFNPQKREQYAYLSLMYDHKRPSLLVKLFSRLPYRLIMMGDGYLRHELEQMATPNVHILGGVTEEQKFKVLRRSLALISASINEGFSIPLCEANYAGTPCLVYDLSIYHEIWGSSSAHGVYYWTDEAELKELIEKAKSLKVDRQYVLERGLTLDKYTERLESMLEKLL